MASAADNLAVGSRVTTRYSADVDVPEDKWPRKAGKIVDEYRAAAESEASDFGRDWAIAKHWAVMLDDGALVFRDDDEIEPEN